MATWADLINALVHNVANPSGCWKDFNNDHKAWIGLNQLADSGTIIRQNDVPPEPLPEEYSSLDPEC